MSTLGTIPILGTDGQVHSIPQDQASAALAAGGKPVATMRDPSGQARWIPSDQVEAAQAAGGTVLSRAPNSEELDFMQKNPNHTWVTRSPNFPNRDEGIYPTGPGNEWRSDPTLSQAPIDLHLARHTLEGAATSAVAVGGGVLGAGAVNAAVEALPSVLPHTIAGVKAIGSWAQRNPIGAWAVLEAIKSAVPGAKKVIGTIKGVPTP